ncbi:MAG: hypothetical protein B7Z81_06470, partial [Acidocella sp. 20-61-6]
PTLSVLRDLIVAPPANEDDRKAQDKLREMHDLIELLTGWADDVHKLETGKLVSLLTLGSRVVGVLELKNRLPFLGQKERKEEQTENSTSSL